MSCEKGTGANGQIGHCHPNEEILPRTSRYDLPRAMTKIYKGRGGHIGPDPYGEGHGTLQHPAQQTFKRVGS